MTQKNSSFVFCNFVKTSLFASALLLGASIAHAQMSGNTSINTHTNTSAINDGNPAHHLAMNSQYNSGAQNYTINRAIGWSKNVDVMEKPTQKNLKKKSKSEIFKDTLSVERTNAGFLKVGTQIMHPDKNYDTVSAQSLYDGNQVPITMRLNSEHKLVGGMGAVTITPARVLNVERNQLKQAFSVTYETVPQPYCEAFVNMVWMEFRHIAVNDWVVRNSELAYMLNQEDLTSACQSSGTSKIIFTAI